MGVTLLESCMFDIRDSLLLETKIQNLKEGTCRGGCGPNQEQFQKRKIGRILEAGEKFGEEIKKHVVSSTAAHMIQKTTNEERILVIKMLREKVNRCKVAQKFKVCYRAVKLHKNSKKYNKK